MSSSEKGIDSEHSQLLTRCSNSRGLFFAMNNWRSPQWTLSCGRCTLARRLFNRTAFWRLPFRWNLRLSDVRMLRFTTLTSGYKYTRLFSSDMMRMMIWWGLFLAADDLEVTISAIWWGLFLADGLFFSSQKIQSRLYLADGVRVLISSRFRSLEYYIAENEYGDSRPVWQTVPLRQCSLARRLFNRARGLEVTRTTNSRGLFFADGLFGGYEDDEFFGMSSSEWGTWWGWRFDEVSFSMIEKYMVLKTIDYRLLLYMYFLEFVNWSWC